MAAIVAHLTDHVLPDQPLRQWVLSVPWSLRIHLACSPTLTPDVGQRRELVQARRCRTGERVYF